MDRLSVFAVALLTIGTIAAFGVVGGYVAAEIDCIAATLGR